MSAQRGSQRENDSVKRSRRKKRQRSQDTENVQKLSAPSSGLNLPLALRHAIFLYFRRAGLRKTARAWSKDTQTRYKRISKEPNFSLGPLFDRISEELKREELSHSLEPKVAKIVSRVDEEEQQWFSGVQLAEADSFGDQAAVDLGKVKGKDFRKEKAKKKKSSWRGNGEISFQTQSIRLDDED